MLEEFDKATEEFDLAVVGAGIVGATAAYLARRQAPEWSILVVDRSLVGDGATSYSAGLDIPYGRSAAQKEYSLLSTRVYAELARDIPGLPVRELPFFAVVSKARARDVLGGFTAEGVRVADAREESRLRESYADLVVSEEQVLLTGCTARYGFPPLVAAALVSSLKRGGRAECWEGVEVQNVRPRAGGFTLETGDGRAVFARRVLAATGPWVLGGPGGGFAADAGVRIKKVAALHVNRPVRPQDPVLLFFDEDAFLLPVAERGEWIFSFTSEDWDCAPEVSRLKIDAGERERALRVLGRYCPSFVPLCRGGRVFCDAYSPGRVPLVARVADGFVVAGACSGSGYRLAPAVGLKALEQFTPSSRS